MVSSTLGKNEEKFCILIGHSSRKIGPSRLLGIARFNPDQAKKLRRADLQKS